jgi:hypothetical protein
VLENAGTVTLTLLRTNGTYGSPSVTVNRGQRNRHQRHRFFLDKPAGHFCQRPDRSHLHHADHRSQHAAEQQVFHVFLSSPTAGASLDTNIPPLVPSNTVVTIIDDHFQPGYLSFSSPSYSVLKPGLATISVTAPAPPWAS